MNLVFILVILPVVHDQGHLEGSTHIVESKAENQTDLEVLIEDKSSPEWQGTQSCSTHTTNRHICNNELDKYSLDCMDIRCYLK